MKNSLLTDKEQDTQTVLGSVKATEPKKLTAKEQIKKAIKMHLKGVYLF